MPSLKSEIDLLKNANKPKYGSVEKRSLWEMSTNPSTLAVHSSLIFAYMIWGGGAIVGKFGVSESSPIVFELYREAFTCAGLVVAIPLLGHRLLPDRLDMPRILIAGFAYYVNQFGWFVGIKVSDPVTGSTWQAFLPILTMIVACLIGQEVLRMQKIVGIAIAASGAIFLVVFDSHTSASGHALGHIIFFIAMSGTSAYFLLHQKLGSKYPALSSVFWANACGSALLFITSHVVARNDYLHHFFCKGHSLEAEQSCLTQGWSISHSMVFPLFYEVILCTFVAWCLINWANQHAEASVVTVYIACHPVTCTIASALLVLFKGSAWGHQYDLKLPGVGTLGILVIIIGLLVIFKYDKKHDTASVDKTRKPKNDTQDVKNADDTLAKKMENEQLSSAVV